MLRLSLDISKSSSCPSETSKGSVLYSASQLGGDQEEGSEVMEEEEDTVNFDDTLSDLEAVSLGLPGHQRQKKSGSMFLPNVTESYLEDVCVNKFNKTCPLETCVIRFYVLSDNFQSICF